MANAFIVPHFTVPSDNTSSATPVSQASGSSTSKGFYTPDFTKFTPTKTQQKAIDDQKRLDQLAAQEATAPKQGNFFSDAANNVGNFFKSTIVDPAVNLYKQVDTSVKAGVTTPNGGAGLNDPKLVQNQVDYIKSQVGKGIDQKTADAQIAKLQGNAATRQTNITKAEQQTGTKLDQNAGVQALGDTATNLSGLGFIKGLALRGIEKGTTKAAVSALADSQAAQDAAILKAKGINPIATEHAPQALTTAPTTQTNEVVQHVNPTTGEKTFFRIPSDSRDSIVNQIDNTRNGTATAGVNNNGIVEHVTAKSPEQMAKLGFKDGGTYGSQVGKAVDNVATPAGETAVTPGVGQSRYISKTIPDSEFVGTDTKALVKNADGSYQKTSNALRADQSLQQLDAEGTLPFAQKVSSRLEGQHITDQTVFDAQAAAQALEKVGTPEALQQATDIYSKVSQHLTKAGQTVQAAAILAKQTPQGLRFTAQRQLENAKVELTPQIQKELDDHIKAVEAAPKGSPEEGIARDNVQYFVAQHIPSSAGDKIVNFWRAGLLTSPTTTGGALAGNLAQTIQRKLVTNPIATLADRVIALKTGKITSDFAAPGVATKEGAKAVKVLASKQYRKTGYDPLTAAQEGDKYSHGAPTNYGPTPLGKAVSGYVNGVYKVMGAADLPFRHAAYAESLSSMARSEAKTQGLKGAEFDSFVKDFMDQPPVAAKEQAVKESKAAVFANDTALGTAASSASTALKNAGHHNAAAFVNFLVPFSKVPSAVATKVITSTPLGTAGEIVKQIVKVSKGGKFDQRAMAKAIGEGTTGVPIIGAGYALGQSGAVTGGYPSDPIERAQWVAEGKQPNSVKIGDRWYSLNYIQPFATLLATGAKIAEAEKSGVDTGEVVSQALAATGQSLLSQSFVQGLSGAIDAVKNPTAYAGKFVASTAGGVIPNFIRAAASATDPNQREVSGALQGIIAGIPGARENLKAKTNEDGSVITAKDNPANQFLNPLKPSIAKQTNNTALYQEAVQPARNLKAVRTREVNNLINNGQVKAAQRKIDDYNAQMEKIIAPYIAQHPLSDDQKDIVKALYLGSVGINKRNQPFLSTSSNQ